MASSSTRAEIVTQAVQIAGRSSELTTSANLWLNFFLRYVGLNFRFPELRKIGSSITLASGASTAALPTDFGSGMDKSGLLFGSEKTPLNEYSFEDFVQYGGFPQTATATGRAQKYIVDREAGVFRFDLPADQAYPFLPVYFKTPPLLSTTSSDDNSKIWLDNDLIAVHGLIWQIYVYTNDSREDAQEQRVERMLNKWLRETIKMGGSSRLILAPARFKNSQVRGMGGGGFWP